MSEKMKAYRINMITPEDAANGAKKGAIVYFFGTHPDDPNVYLFVDKPGAEEGIPLYMQQVARAADYDRDFVESPAASEAEKIEELPDFDPAVSEQWESSQISESDQEFVDEVVAGLSRLVETRGVGLKHDGGKPRPSLLIRGMPRALMRVAEVLTFGAEKYEAHSWRNVENGEERYDDAKLRHMFKDAMGEVADSESTIEHLAHECCNLLFLLEKKLTAEGYTF